MGLKNKDLSSLFAKEKKKKLMTIFSHPDDECLLVGGILAKAKEEGVDTIVVALSRGEKGSFRLREDEKEIGKIREKEFRRACKALGVSKAVIFNFPDLAFDKAKRKLQKTIEQLLRKESPQAVITHDPSGGYGHPDHIITSFLVKDVLGKLKRKGIKTSLYFPVLKKKVGRETQKSKEIGKYMPKPTAVIDISLFAKKKARACREYRSQVSEGKLVFFDQIFSRLLKKEFLHKVDFRKKYTYPEI